MLPPETLRLDLLCLIAQDLQKGNLNGAQDGIERFPKLSPHDDPSDLQYSLFLNALHNRLRHLLGQSSGDSDSLYLIDFEIKQIDLFNLMARKMPLVAMGASLSNLILSSQVEPGDDITLLDIGIGTGRQEAEWLRTLARLGKSPRSLEVIGVEPAAGALATAERSIAEAATDTGVEVHFEAVTAFAEALPESKWRTFARPDGKLLVNSAFSLHHARDLAEGEQPPRRRDAKQRVLGRIRELAPQAFILCEPDSDHATHSLWDRFLNAWRHFGLVFRVIDRIPDLTDDEKGAMKAFFFGREIEDILGPNETERTERHESGRLWNERLQDEGFDELPQLPVEAACAMSGDLVQVEPDELGFKLAHEGHSIVRIFATH